MQEKGQCEPCGIVIEPAKKGVKSRDEELLLVVRPKRCERCCKCRSKFTATSRRCKYVQPERPGSFKPIRWYEKPEEKLDDSTVYRLSYVPIPGAPSEKVIHGGNLGCGEGKMSGDTVNNMTYKNNGRCEQRCPYYPKEHVLMGVGPMQALTTHKHDYGPKDVVPVKCFKAETNLYVGDGPFVGETVSMLSYKPIDATTARPTPVVRPLEMTIPEGKMDDRTTSRTSYVPWKVQRRPATTCGKAKEYRRSEDKMSDDTIYKASYVPQKMSRVASCKPHPTYSPPKEKMAGDTVYNNSYLPLGIERPTKFLPVNNLNVGDGRMSGATTNNLSYTGQKVARPEKFQPCQHDHMGKGPMQTVTTHKHDYVYRKAEKSEVRVHKDNLYVAEAPMSDKTVNRMTYTPYDVTKLDRRRPYYLEDGLRMFSGKVAYESVHQTSYKHWQAQPKEEKPWVPNHHYKPPVIKMDGNTVHSMSYSLPGRLVECPEGEEPHCVLDCPQTEQLAQEECNCCCSCESRAA